MRRTRCATIRRSASTCPGPRFRPVGGWRTHRSRSSGRSGSRCAGPTGRGRRPCCTASSKRNPTFLRVAPAAARHLRRRSFGRGERRGSGAHLTPQQVRARLARFLFRGRHAEVAVGAVGWGATAGRARDRARGRSRSAVAAVGRAHQQPGPGGSRAPDPGPARLQRCARGGLARRTIPRGGGGGSVGRTRKMSRSAILLG